jgi:hypothetical protein
VNAAAALLGEEDTAAVGAVVERGQSAEVPVAVPALGLDALLLLLRDGYLILLAAGAADMAVPVLQNREMTDRKRHRQPGATRTTTASAFDYCTRFGRETRRKKNKRATTEYTEHTEQRQKRKEKEKQKKAEPAANGLICCDVLYSPLFTLFCSSFSFFRDPLARVPRRVFRGGSL